MNYGKNEVARKLKKSSSKTEKITSKLVLLFLKMILVMIIFAGVLGVSLGYGIFKGGRTKEW